MYFTKHTYLNFKTCMFFARYYFVKAKHVCYFFKFKTCLLYTKHYYAKAKHVCHTQNMFALHKTLFCQSKTCFEYKKIARLRLAALAIVLFRAQFPFVSQIFCNNSITNIHNIDCMHSFASCIILHHA